MDLTVLNQNFETVFILDAYESLIWVDKYSSPGTFEIYTPVTENILNYIQPDNYLQKDDSEHLMIVEDISIESNSESGDHIKIIGRSLESILDRRIIWSQTDISDKLENGIKRLLNENIIKPRLPKRKIPNFVFENSGNTYIDSCSIETQFSNEDNLLEAITFLCDQHNVGFMISLNQDKQFVFKLYTGEDRSYDQNTNPYVVFRPSFDNLINSNYTDKHSIIKNVTLVVGEEIQEENENEEGHITKEGTGEYYQTVVGDATGIARRELFTSASDIQKEIKAEEEGEEDVVLTEEEYIDRLKSKGEEVLKETNKDKNSFDGKCETNILYQYGKDFFMGDIVQIANEYGIESASRVTEFTWSYSISGIDTYPTFSVVEKE